MMEAAQVAGSCNHTITAELQEKWRQLRETHPAPRWLWPALVPRLVGDGWTVEETRRQGKTRSGTPTRTYKHRPAARQLDRPYKKCNHCTMVATMCLSASLWEPR